MKNVRVAVLRGGPSAEFDVSMQTGASVLAALDTDKYEPIDVVITKTGEWLVGGYVKFPEQVLNVADVIFNGLHGTYGEDGTVQRLLDSYGIPYTGSGAYASHIAMHKAITKDHLRDSSIHMPPHTVITKDSLHNLHGATDSIIEMFGPQYVIKPVASGSSVGVMMVDNPQMLQSALKDALNVYDEVIVEKRIRGKEATCGVIENYRNEDHYVLPVVEIVPPAEADFFDNKVKYDDTTAEICPGRFTDTEKKTMADAAKFIHAELGLSHYSRSDFMVGEDGIYFLEVNTLPGLTPQSLLPKSIEAVGGTYAGFVDHLLTEALERR